MSLPRPAGFAEYLVLHRRGEKGGLCSSVYRPSGVFYLACRLDFVSAKGLQNPRPTIILETD